MNWIENLLILLGISLDIYAGMVCRGSLIAKIHMKHLAVVCAMIAVWQLAALYLGELCASFLYVREPAIDKKYIGLVIAAVIFFGLGIRLIVKAIRNERVDEHREDEFKLGRFAQMAAFTAIYTLLAGIAFGFLETKLSLILIMIVCLTVAAVIAGVYTGYRFGFVHKTKAYIGGAALLWIAGVDVILRYIR